MPELDFIFGFSETDTFVAFVLSQGAWLTPANSLSREFPRLDSLLAYQACRMEGERLFHIQHASFSSMPLDIRSVVRQGQQEYYAMQRHGGPTIDLFGPSEFNELGTPRVGTGFLGYYPSVWDPVRQVNVPAPTTQKDLFRRLGGRLRRMATKAKVGTRVYWVGNETAKAFRAGLVQLPSSYGFGLQWLGESPSVRLQGEP